MLSFYTADVSSLPRLLAGDLCESRSSEKDREKEREKREEEVKCEEGERNRINCKGEEIRGGRRAKRSFEGEIERYVVKH